MSVKLVLSATCAGLLLATSAHAVTSATVWTDLNLRAGPDVTYPIVSVIGANQEVIVDGCLDASNWCRVTHGEFNGWASGEYLTAMVPALIVANRERLLVESVTYEKDPSGTLAGGGAGALAGAMVAGPVGALVGAAIGLGLGAAATPEERVTTYVRENPGEPIYLDGEIVVGAGIPETVALAEVPDSEYTTPTLTAFRSSSSGSSAASCISCGKRRRRSRRLSRSVSGSPRSRAAFFLCPLERPPSSRSISRSFKRRMSGAGRACRHPLACRDWDRPTGRRECCVPCG